MSIPDDYDLNVLHEDEPTTPEHPAPEGTPMEQCARILADMTPAPGETVEVRAKDILDLANAYLDTRSELAREREARAEALDEVWAVLMPAYTRAVKHDDDAVKAARASVAEIERLRAKLATSERATGELRRRLEEIAERSSYPIDPRDAFEDALDRARAALRALSAPAGGEPTGAERETLIPACDLFVALADLAKRKDIEANGPNPPLTLRSIDAVTLTMNEILLAFGECERAAASSPGTPTPRCSFCGKAKDAVRQLAERGSARICSECVEEIRGLMVAASPGTTEPTYTPTTPTIPPSAAPETTERT